MYLPAINADLEAFRKGWNVHKLRTENHKSPQQIWLSGMLDNISRRYTSPNEFLSASQDIGERLATGLSRFGITLDDLGVTGADTEPVRIVNDTELSALQEVFEIRNGSNKEKLRKCIQVLMEMYNYDVLIK